MTTAAWHRLSISTATTITQIPPLPPIDQPITKFIHHDIPPGLLKKTAQQGNVFAAGQQCHKPTGITN